MKPKRSREHCLSPVFHLFGPQGRRFVAQELKGFGFRLEEADRKHSGRQISYVVQSRGLGDLQHLLLWLARGCAVRWRAGLGSFVTCMLLVACVVLLFRPLPRTLPFADSVVFTATVSGSALKSAASEQPRLIPRVVHQTFPSLEAVPSQLANIRQSWAQHNPGWQIRFWDDALCREFVRREFPEYYSAYVGLPKNVERADFFRYLVVLRHGGVYADIDAECMHPLDNLIRSSDTLLAGWEGEVTDGTALVHRHFARYRQVCRFQIRNRSTCLHSCDSCMA
jgi:Glycosyltransferase sugar-binding region containing DXD motif